MTHSKNKTEKSFHQEVTNWLQHVPISTGDNLIGFQIDIDHALDSTELFFHIKTTKTGNSACALIASCQLQSPIMEKEALEALVIKLWKERLSYSFFQTYYISWEENTLKFRFLTATGNTADHLLVTGLIEIQND